LLALPVARQIELACEAAEKQLTVREVEQRVGSVLKGVGPRRARVDRDVARLEEEWSQRLGTTVQIKPRGNRGGKLVLTYRTLDDLDRLLARLGSN
jgi:ParB family chromosome partitioning protein